MKNNGMSKIDVRENMFRELDEKRIFEQAKQYAFEYADHLRERNVYPTESNIGDLVVFDEELTGLGSEPARILEKLHLYGSPATVVHTGGRYFGFVVGGALPISLAAKWLSDFWDQNAAVYVLSPIASKLESVVEKWLNNLFGLPESTVAGFVSGTSIAILSALAAARYRIFKRLNWDVNTQGLFNAPKLRIITSRQIHGTVIKAIAILGFGKDNIEWVDVDDQGRIVVEKIPEMDDGTILIIQAGNVNSGSFDDFDKICDKAKRANAWVHIDGAFGLWAAGSQQLKYLIKGIEKANSWTVDGHKTLNTPYDCGIVLCNDKEALVAALQATGSYIQYGENRDGMMFTPEMSRRARGVEMWAAMKYLGKEGIDDLVYGLHVRAKQFAEELKVHGFNVLNDVVFNQVLVSGENDENTDAILKLIQESGICWCGGSMWRDKKVIRISVCSWATTKEDILQSAAAFAQAKEKAQISISASANNQT
jgi:glutamate/tyrosine decarboxylase-like PLP-dependent enzyme